MSRWVLVSFVLLLALARPWAAWSSFLGVKEFIGEFDDPDLPAAVLQYGNVDLGREAHGRMQPNQGLQRLLLRYTACTGLANQQYSHIAAFSLAAALQADIVVPPAAHRASPRAGIKQKGQRPVWSPASADSLLDVEQIRATWASQGVAVHTVSPCPPLPCCVLQAK
jgi:hypothetical protein